MLERTAICEQCNREFISGSHGRLSRICSECNSKDPREKANLGVCKFCGRALEYHGDRGPAPTFCDYECRKKWHGEHRAKSKGQTYQSFVPGERNCERCGISFLAKGQNAKYCPLCRALVNQERTFKKYLSRCAVVSDRFCEHCGKQLNQSQKRFCSRKCAGECGGQLTKETQSRTESFVCQHCGKQFTPKAADRTTFCSRDCAFAYKTARSVPPDARKRIDRARRRALLRGCVREAIDPIAIFERDNWRCHICGKKAPARLRGTTDDRAPELDHIMPLAKGGSHTWDNVACAHRKCNQKKSDKLPSEMMLTVSIQLRLVR